MTSESTPDKPAGAALPTSRTKPASLPSGAVAASWLQSANVSVLREVALLPVLALLLIFGTVKSPVFLTVSNFSGIGEQSAALGVVVVGESLILMIGGMDLSLESTYGLAPMVAAWLIVPIAAYGNGLDLNPYLGIGVLIAVGAAIGLVNGVIVTRLHVSSLIATLATLGIATGIANIATGGTDVTGIPVALQNDVGIRDFESIPLPALIALAVWGVMWVLFRTTRFGLRMLALGSSRSAAERSGIRVKAQLVIAFVIVGSLAGLAGFIELTRFATTNLAGHQTDALAAIRTTPIAISW